MAKKRKTKQEKIIADLRRKIEMQSPPTTSPAAISNTYSIPSVKISSPVANLRPDFRPRGSQQASNSSYAYVISDLKKTVILTIIAIAAQIGLYFVLMG